MAGDLEKQRRGASPAPQVTSPDVEPERPFPLRSWPPRSRSSPPPGALPAIPATTAEAASRGMDSFQEGQCLDGLGPSAPLSGEPDCRPRPLSSRRELIETPGFQLTPGDCMRGSPPTKGRVVVFWATGEAQLRDLETYQPVPNSGAALPPPGDLWS